MSVGLDPAPSDGAVASVGHLRGRRRRVGERWTAGHVVPVVLAVLAAVFVLSALRDRSATVPVPVASASIPAGAPVDAADTHLVKLHRSDGSVLAGLLGSAALGQGWVASSRIGAGEPITRSEVTRAGTSGRGLGSMSIPVPLDQADGGGIVVGDRVDVIAPSAGGGAVYVAQGLRVLSVASTTNSGVLAGATNSYFLVVAVDRATALRVAAALGSPGSSPSAGSVEVVRSTGETAPAPRTSLPPPSRSSTSSSRAGSGVAGGGGT